VSRQRLVPVLLLFLSVKLPGATDQLGLQSLLIGCYRYLPGDCTGIFVPAAKDDLRRVVGGTRPVWSPDRSRFAYVTNSVIWIADLDGNRRGEYASDDLDTGKGGICWSHDGEDILFGSDVSGYGIVGRLRADNIGLRGGPDIGPGLEELLLEEGQTGLRFPAASPDGQHIAFCRSEGILGVTTLVSTLCWARTDALRWHSREQSADTPLSVFTVAPNPGYERHQRPCWSPDAQRIGFDITDTRTGANMAAWISPSEGEVHPVLHPKSDRLTTPHSTWFLGWLSEGEMLIGSGRSSGAKDLWRISVDGKSYSRLFRSHFGPIWDVAISPDRQKVAYVVTAWVCGPGECHSTSGNTGVLVLDLDTSETTYLFDNMLEMKGDLRDRPRVPYCLAW